MISPVGKRRARKLSTGFTLVELIFVLLIISVAVGLAAPRLKNTFTELEFDHSVRTFARVIEYARQMAIMERSTYLVKVNAELKSYFLEREVVEEGIPTYRRLKGRFGRTFHFPSSVKVAAPIEELACLADGGAGPAEFTVTSRAGSASKVRVEPYPRSVSVEGSSR